MKKNLWISISAAVILIAAVVCFVFVYNYHKSEVLKKAQSTMSKAAPKPITVITPQLTGTGAKDSSDTSINQDLSNIDVQMNGLNSDTSIMNNSVNNQ